MIECVAAGPPQCGPAPFIDPCSGLSRLRALRPLRPRVLFSSARCGLESPRQQEPPMSAVAATPAAPSPVTNSGRIFNFSAGPGCLPEEVLKEAQQDIWNIAAPDGKPSGVGILEHSHRAKVY